jgi:hypothetical protein
MSSGAGMGLHSITKDVLKELLSNFLNKKK